MAFLGDTLYVLSAGGGCSRGFQDMPAGVVRANADRTWTEVGDLSAFYTANPTAAPLDDDYEPDGGTYGLSAVDGKLYIVDANHAEFDEIALDGQIRRVVDMSASEGHITPTALTFRDGAFYVGNLGEFPIQQGTSKIFRVTPDGQTEVLAEGLTAVLGLAFDSQGQLYALETSTVDNNLPVPGAGRVVRVGQNSALEPVATGLSFPGGLAVGPDGQLYVSNFAYGGDPSKGEILRIDVAASPKPASLPATGGINDMLPSIWLVVLAGVGLVGVGWRLRRR